ncbi:MAG: SOS response-associated peptidase [Candidatus Omnitrophota bacterium]
MCGRFTLTVRPEKIAQELGIPVEHLPKIPPRFNIAPGQSVLCLTQTPEEGPAVSSFQWGLVPAWAEDPALGMHMINARAESLTEKPSFRGPLKESRCLIPADGFFEWKAAEEGKVPYYFRLRSRGVFTFAGLWTRWTAPTGVALRTCTIITTRPNALVAGIHPRMPVILAKKDRAAWIDPANYDTRQLTSLLEPYPASAMETYPVSRTVNDPENDTDECIIKL